MTVAAILFFVSILLKPGEIFTDINVFQDLTGREPFIPENNYANPGVHMEPDSTIIVSRDGSGDFTNVQAAFDAAPDNYTGRVIIFVNPGIYYEKLLLDRNKVNVILAGRHPDSTILTYDDYAGIAGGTSKSYSVAIEPDDFTAINITFQNTVKNDGTVRDQQAVALRVNGDRQSYYNCKLLGYQDTYYTWGGRGTGRIYMKGCYIEGSVDFIFGRNIVVFDSCEIHVNRDKGIITAASTEADSKYGYVFRNCIITVSDTGFNGKPVTGICLGRPWHNAPRTVFLYCREPSAIVSEGWRTWNVPPALYAEYKCYGEGSGISRRLASISRQLTDEEAAEYVLENIFSKDSNPLFNDDWIPARYIKVSVPFIHI